jgi:EmrB/QacA subfamily drug resistance transporter
VGAVGTICGEAALDIFRVGRSMNKMQRRLLVLLCVSVPSFMINLDANIVAVALPAISHSLRADFSAIEWVISAYTLAFATLLMTAGAMADRFGRKRMLVTGLVIFTIASGICGAAGSATVLDYARALQGVGAALQLSAALAVLADSFRGEERARAFAFWGSVIGVAITLGPVAGGFITEVIGWRWAFYVNLPIGLAMIALTLCAVTESKDPNAVRIDFAGAFAFSGFLCLLTLALISGNQKWWTSTATAVEVGAAIGFLISLLIAETVQDRPMIELKYFSRPTFLGVFFAGLAYAGAFLPMLTYLPFFFQTALGFSPLVSGMLMLPLAVPLFVMPRVVALFLNHRLSGRELLTLALALVGTGLLITSSRISSFHYVPVVQGLFIASLGAGILNGQLAKVVMTVIPVERAGMASGVVGTTRFTGIVVGFASLGAILFEGIGTNVRNALPRLDAAERFSVVHLIANGHLSSAVSLIEARGGSAELARSSFGYGYDRVLLAAATLALVGAVLSWILVSAEETAPQAVPDSPTPELLD